MSESQPLQEPTAAAAPVAGAEPAGAPPAVVPGKEFTRTCKGLVVVLIGGYVLLQLLPSSLNYLAIIPSKTIPYVWTVFTAGYIEQVLPGAIGSSLGLLFCGKDIEPVWGRKEFLRFIVLVNSICGILAFFFAIALYYVTGKESFLVTPLSGFHGCLAGFLVALKQLLPNLELPMCFFWKIKAKDCIRSCVALPAFHLNYLPPASWSSFHRMHPPPVRYSSNIYRQGLNRIKVAAAPPKQHGQAFKSQMLLNDKWLSDQTTDVAICKRSDNATPSEGGAHMVC